MRDGAVITGGTKLRGALAVILGVMVAAGANAQTAPPSSAPAKAAAAAKPAKAKVADTPRKKKSFLGKLFSK